MFVALCSCRIVGGATLSHVSMYDYVQAAEAASRREAGLGNRIEELEKENNDLRKQLQRLKDSSQAKIAQLVTDRKQCVCRLILDAQ